MTFNIESQKQAGKCQRIGMRGWDTERAISGRQLSGRARKSVGDVGGNEIELVLLLNTVWIHLREFPCE